MQAFRARWVWDAPGGLRADACVVMEGGRVIEVAPRPPAGAVTTDLGSGLLMPGLVNAHTHLELSFLAGAVPPRGDFVGWLHQMVAARPGHDKEAASRHAAQAVEFLRARGVALVADITNTGRAADLLDQAGLSAVSFMEALGEARCEPPQAALAWRGGHLVGHGVAAHAPYSVPASRLKALKRRAGSLPYCLHLAESRAEVEFLLGEGEEGARLEEFLLERGLRRDRLELTGLPPLAHVTALGLLDEHTLLVHGVQLTAADGPLIAQSGASLCLCPRSNLGLTGSMAPAPALLAAGVNLCLGTDSLASTPDLDPWAEMATLAARFPELAPRAILTMATHGGAKALGLGEHYGSLRPGARGPLAFAPLGAMGAGEVLEAVVRGDLARAVRPLRDQSASNPIRDQRSPLARSVPGQ